MNRAIVLAMKRKVANILRERTTNGLDEKTAETVKKQLFEILDGAGTEDIIPILLATLLEAEVSKYEQEN